MVAAGRIGNTDSLALEKAGLTAGARGILAVNETFQTTQPHIRAAGDVIGLPALASTIGEQAIEVINIALLAMQTNGTFQAFIDACFNFPSLAECTNMQLTMLRDENSKAKSALPRDVRRTPTLAGPSL